MLVSLEQAVRLLDDGEIVAIPTETVYGLAADSGSDRALTRLYETKGRPADHPVILHVADAEMCRPYLADLPEAARALMEAYWPGPLTLLLPRAETVSPRITGGRSLVGVRAPATPLAQQLLRLLGRPVVAPSANRFGHISPTSAQHVEDEFEGRVPVLDGGDCAVGLESTILAVEPNRLVVMRPGQIDLEQVEKISGLPVTWPEQPLEGGGVPGALKSHYAPRQPVTLLASDELRRRTAEGCAVLCLGEGRWEGAATVIGMPEEADVYAQRLYGNLRVAEASDAAEILIELPPSGAEWRAVHDRLARAAAR